MKGTVNVENLIGTFSSMAKRKSLLTKDDLQEDLLIQIIGTIVKVAMTESEAENRQNVTLVNSSDNNLKRVYG